MLTISTDHLFDLPAQLIALHPWQNFIADDALNLGCQSPQVLIADSR
jgi:hypothetical protein